MDDKRIIDLFWNRIEGAIDAVKRKYSKLLLQIGLNILNNQQDAEEAENDTYLALWNAIPPARPDPLPPYVCRVGRNCALKRLSRREAQKRNSRYDLCLEELAEILPGSTLEDMLDGRLLGQAVDTFLSTLSKEDRVMFVRRYWFGDDIGDLARRFAISRSNTSVRLYRIRDKLKHFLIKEGFSL